MAKAPAWAIDRGCHVLRTRGLTGLRLVLLERLHETTDTTTGHDDAARRKVHL